MTAPKYDLDPYATQEPAPGGYDADPYGTAAAAPAADYADDPYGVEEQVPTARGIAAATAQNRAQNVQALQALYDSPKTSAAQKERIKRLIDTTTDPAYYNTVTEDRFFGSNYLRGVATGVVSEGLLGTTDFLASVAELGLEGADALFDTKAADAVEAFRGQIAEAQQITQDTFDAQGISGTAGRVTGALASQLVGGGSKAAVTGVKSAFGGGAYGAAATKAAEQLAKLPGFIGRAAQLGQKGNFVQRMLVNVVAGSPIDFIQAYTLPESEEVKIAQNKQEQGIALTLEDETALDDHMERQLGVLAMGLTASGLGGALVEGSMKALGGTASKIKAGAAKKANMPDSEAELTSKADAMILLRAVAKKRISSRKAGSAAWNAGNIDTRRKLLTGLTDDDYALEFSKLPPDIKQALMESFGGPKIGPLGSDSQMNTLPAPGTAAQPATTAGASSPVTPGQAPPVAAPTPAPAPAALKATPQDDAATIVGAAQELFGREALTKEVAKVLKKRQNPPNTAAGMAAIIEAVARKMLDAEPEVAAAGVKAAVKTGGGTAGKAGKKPKTEIGEKAAKLAATNEALERPVSVIDKTLTDVEGKLKAARERETELERRLMDVERQAATDNLTGFQNQNAWGKAKDRIDADETVEVVMLDIGHLKATNDNVSFGAGDELIRRAAESTRGAVGEADKAQFFRVGGDEVVVVVPKGRGSAVGDAAVHAFGITPVGEVGVNNFLRYGVGATAAEADVAVQAAKKSSTQVRYDRATQSTIRTIEQPVKPADATDMEIEKLRKQQLTAAPVEALRIERKIRELRKAAVASAQPEVGPDTKVDAGPPAAPHRQVEDVITRSMEPQPAKRTLDQIDDDIGRIEDDLEAGDITQAVATARLGALGREKVALKKSMKPGAAPTLDIAMPGTVGKDLSKYEPEQLIFVKRNIRSLLNNVERGTPEEAALQTEFKRIMEYEAKRDGGHGVIAQMHPSITGGVGGFTAGYLWPADSDEERLRHAVWFGALGIGGGVYANRRWGPGVPRGRPKLTAWETEVARKVYSHDDIKKPPVPFLMRLRQFYQGFISRSESVVTATRALGGENLPVQRNPGKLMQVFGRWQAQTESFLIDGPSLIDKDGNVQWLDALPVQKIFEPISGDSDKLGLLMASARALELGAKGVESGIDPLAARLTFIKSAPEYHTAMTEMRKFNAALVDVADDAGLVADRAKMSDVFYAPLNRIFGGTVGAAPSTQTVTSKVKAALGIPNPIKALKGGKQVLLNPAEATVGNTPRILKASEMNKMASSLADLLDAAPDRALAGRIGRFLHGSERKTIPGFALKVARLQQEMESLGTSLSQTEAEKLIHTMSNEALGLQDDVLRFWRKGKIEQLRLNPEVAKAFRSLNPEEMGGLVKFLGLPTHATRIGIVNNPLFVARQAWRDNWQAWLNSEYGFIPFVTQAQGWFHAVTRSPQYKEYLAAGGGYGSFAEQRFAKGQTALPDVQRAPVKNALDQTVKEAKELKIISAYQTLITPIIEAARVGEFLRARGQGISALESVYAAKHVTANYQDIGTSMRAAGHLTLFLNPAIKSLEQSAKSFGRDPVAYLTKAFVGIALPSYYFWHSYQKDEELNQLRQTETGRRYWWMRSPAGIVKIPKPIFDGQLFGSTVETVLDKQKLADPESAELTRKSVLNDTWVNLLPQLGVVPYSLLTNQDLGTGIPIVPDRVEGLDAQYQSTPTSSHLARVIGKTANVAPAQIDYAIRNTFGQLGINAVRLISNAVEYQDTGYVPPKEEWPFMEEVFARYPSLNTGSVREFYKHAEKVDEVARTIAHAAKHDAENVEPYITANPVEAGLIDLYKDTRAKLAELRSSAEEIRLAPSDVISPRDKKLYIDEMFHAMIEVSKNANMTAREVKRSFEPMKLNKSGQPELPGPQLPVRGTNRQKDLAFNIPLPTAVQAMMDKAKAQGQSMPEIVESEAYIKLTLSERQELMRAIEEDSTISWLGR